MAIRRLEEIKLLTLCMAADNRAAFSQLVEIHQKGLRRFLLNLTGGNVCLAEDLAQETFIKVWKGIRTFQGLAGFRTWLYHIAINEYNIWLRRYGRFEYAPADECTSIPPIDTFSAIDVRIDVAQAIKRLPEKEKMVVLLFYLEDLKIADIARVTGMPEGTVKSHLARAREHLAKLIRR